MANPNFVPNFSTNDLYRDTDITRCLTDDLDTIESDIDTLQTDMTGKAAVSHTHDGYATSDHTHTGYAAEDHTHTGYALTSHTHTASEISDLPSSVDAYSKTESDARYATTSHTHTGYAAEDHTHSGYAVTNHTHTEYATTSHNHDTSYAPVTHIHSEYSDTNHTHTPASIGAATSTHTHTPASIGAAASGHTHSDYASSSHAHSTYFEKTGGTISGETNFSGGLVRLKSVQTLYHSGSMLVFGSTSLPHRIAGSTVSSSATISVDSDERLKRNIHDLNEATLAEFVEGLHIVGFNYNTDPAEMPPRIGVIAQEVQVVDPEVAEFFVGTNEDGMLNVKESALVYALAAAIQKLSARVAELEAK